MSQSDYSQLFAKLSTTLAEASEIAAKLARDLPALTIATTTPASVVAAGKSKGKPGPKAGANKKEKKERDPEAPKRPMTAFLLYSRDRRSSFVTEHPEITGRAITTGLADEWRSLDPAKKAPYEAAYQSSMDGWRDAKATYEHPEGAEGEGGPSSAPAPKAAAPPTAPAAAAAPPAQPFVAPAIVVDRAAAAADEEERRRKKEEKKKRKEQKHASEGDGSSAKKKKKHHHDHEE